MNHPVQPSILHPPIIRFHHLAPKGLLLSLLLSPMLTGCSTVPSGVLDKEDMATLLADIYVGESVVDNDSKVYSSDSMKRALRQSVYAHNGVTVEEVDSSLKWYGRHMDKYTEVYERTIEILEKRLEKANSVIDNQASTPTAVALDGDSVDVWPTARYFRFAPNMPADIVAFSLTSDRFWERGDVYTLRAKVVNGIQPTILRLAVDYYDGTTEYVSNSRSGQGWRELSLVLDSAKVASNVYGTIAYPASSSVAGGAAEAVLLDSLTLYRSRWGGAPSRMMRKSQWVGKTK